MRRERARLQLGMELHTDEPGMIFIFDHLRQQSIGGNPAKPQSMLLEAVLIGGIDLITMALPLGDFSLAVYFIDPTAAFEHSRVGAEPHGAAEITARAANLQLVSLHPFGHQPDHGMRRSAEFGRVGVLDPT